MSARLSVSSTSVDLPEPDTPVTTVNAPIGKCAVMSLRLCSVQPEMVRNFDVEGLKPEVGLSIFDLPVR